MSTIRRLLLLGAFLPSFCCYLVFSSSSQSQDQQSRAQVAGPDGTDRMREGTTLEVHGSFKQTGDRIMFYSAGDNRRLGTLENLNLERIARMVSESPDPLEWTVSGTVTEFQGANYLLVTRAVLKSKPQRRAAAARKRPSRVLREPAIPELRARSSCSKPLARRPEIRNNEEQARKRNRIGWKMRKGFEKSFA